MDQPAKLTDLLQRAILGTSGRFSEMALNSGIPKEQVEDVAKKLGPQLYEMLILPAAPIQDAIDLARFMVETTKGFIRFSITRPKTVGGPIEIAAITKHEGFRWVQRKHFFPHDLNVE
jgi:hypothetical protein